MRVIDPLVLLQRKTPYQDGTTHIVMSPLEFLQRLAALVPATAPSHSLPWGARAQRQAPGRDHSKRAGQRQ
jgi:hypothetical protein